MTFSERLHSLMKQYDYRQIALAEKVGVSQQTVSRWVKGKFQPDIDQLIALAKVFNVSIDYLVGLSDCSVQYYDTEKDPSPDDRERAIAIALAARAGIPVNRPLPADVPELILLVQRIVDLEFDKRSTPNDDPSGSRCQTCPLPSQTERQ